jgi:predicted nuclease of predicted toxin-antitoxin system
VNLLFDQNLSPRLVTRLADIFPRALHVSQIGMDRATDMEIWTYAREKNHIIVTKDSDFTDISVLEGAPPKVVWLQIGNATTDEVEALLRRHYPAIQSLAADQELGLLQLF